jgi:cysteine desulfurase / selenocysteine lyase
MRLDLAKLRADTPGTKNVIHLNNCGAALMPRPVLDAIQRHLILESEIGGYEAADAREAECAAVYASVARLIGAQPNEIALFENATLAWDMAFYSLQFRAGDRILTAQAEYGANYVAYLQMAKRTGAVVEVIPNTATGEIDPAALEAMIDERVKLISITWIPTNGGLINPAAEVGKVARRHGIPYLLDACQAAGQLPIDVKALGCDMLSATGRKFLRGPRGTGFLYVREDLIQKLEPARIDHAAAVWVAPDRYQLRDDAKRFETWEASHALRLGLGAAVDYALDLGMEAISARCLALGRRLRAALGALPRVTTYDLGRDPGAIVTFALDGIESAKVEAALAAKKINISTSRPSSTLLDATARQLPVVVRAAPHYYNSEDEIEAMVAAVKALL